MDFKIHTYWCLVEPSDVISKVTVTTDEGKKIRGIIGSKPPHALSPEERKKCRNKRYVH